MSNDAGGLPPIRRILLPTLLLAALAFCVALAVTAAVVPKDRKPYPTPPPATSAEFALVRLVALPQRYDGQWSHADLYRHRVTGHCFLLTTNWQTTAITQVSDDLCDTPQPS